MNRLVGVAKAYYVGVAKAYYYVIRFCKLNIYAGVAQLAEQLTCNQ